LNHSRESTRRIFFFWPVRRVAPVTRPVIWRSPLLAARPGEWQPARSRGPPSAFDLVEEYIRTGYGDAGSPVAVSTT